MAPNIINKILGKDNDETSASSTSSATARDTSTTGIDSSTRASTAGEDSSKTAVAPTQERYETTDHTLAPAVQHEHVTKSSHEEIQNVVDRERHQDHYQTIVQPLKDTEVKPEKHVQQRAETEYREFENEDAAKTQERLAAEQSQFQSTKTQAATEMTSSQNPTQVAEHTHHHLHETVQPVIEKETHQNTVVHTIVPIKETHHEAPQFHGTTTAPVMSIDEFKKQSGDSTADNTTTGV